MEGPASGADRDRIWDGACAGEIPRPLEGSAITLMSEAKLTVDDATITSHIKRIRKKFAALDPGFDASRPLWHGLRWKE